MNCHITMVTTTTDFLHHSHLDAMQGASEERTEPYRNTAKEYRSWQGSGVEGV